MFRFIYLKQNLCISTVSSSELLGLVVVLHNVIKLNWSWLVHLVDNMLKNFAKGLLVIVSSHA